MAEAKPASQKIWLISNDNATMEVGKFILAGPSPSLFRQLQTDCQSQTVSWSSAPCF